MFEESKHPRDSDGKFTNKNNVNQKTLQELKKEQTITLSENSEKELKPVLTSTERRQIESNALQQISRYRKVLKSKGAIQFRVYTFNKIALVSVTKTYDITILKVIENE